MPKGNEDPEFILTVLNSLGYIYVTTNELKDFIKDLKTHRKLKAKAHKVWKDKIKRKLFIKNRRDLEGYMYELQGKAPPSRDPKQHQHVTQVHHQEQNFEPEKSPAREQIQRSPLHTKDKSSIKTPVEKRNRSLQPHFTDPGPSKRNQRRKILETDPRKQQTIHEFDLDTYDSDSYPQLPGQTKKTDGKDKSQARKTDRTLIGKSFDERLIDSNIEALDSYKTLPKPKERSQVKDKSQAEKFKTPLKTRLDEEFPSSFDTSDSYKTLPKPKERSEVKDKSQAEKFKTPLKKRLDEEFPSSFDTSDSYKQLPEGKTDLQFKTPSAGKSVTRPQRTFEKDFPSNLETSDSYKQIARKPRDQEENKSKEKSRSNVHQNASGEKDKSTPKSTTQSRTPPKARNIREQSPIIRGGTWGNTDKSFNESKLDYSDFKRNIHQQKGPSKPDKNPPTPQPREQQRKSTKEQSPILSAGTRTDAEENFIGSGLDYSDFQRNATHGRSSPVEKVYLDQQSSEQLSLRGLRERSHINYDSNASTDSSQQANRIEVDPNLVAKDKTTKRPQLSPKEFREVTRLRFDDSDSESDSESNYLEQQGTFQPPGEMERTGDQNKSQNSAQSTPNFREIDEIIYDSNSKSDSESISQAVAKNKKEEVGKSGKKPRGKFQPEDYAERSHLEY